VQAAGPNTQQADAALLELILEAAVEGIVFVRSDNTIGYINKVGREILRCSRQDDPPPTCVELTTLLGFDPLVFSQEGAVTGKSLDTRETGVALYHMWPAQRPALLLVLCNVLCGRG